MSFFGLVKDFCLMVVLSAVTNACAMEIVSAQHYEILREKAAKKFASDTFAQAYGRGGAQIAPKCFSFKKNCYKTTLIFDIATRLPHDVQKLIVQTLFRVEEIAANKAEMFLNMPIAQALEDYAYTKEVKAGKAALLLKKESSLYTVDKIFVDHGTVFELAKQIDIVDKLLQRDKNFKMVSREELQALVKIIEKNPSLARYWSSPHCNAYNKFTLSLFKEHFETVLDEADAAFIIAMGPLFLALISRIIELKLCNKIVIESVIQENSRRGLANAWMEQSKDIMLRDYRFPMLSVMDYSMEDYYKIYAPYLGLLPWVSISDVVIKRNSCSDQGLLKIGLLGGLVSILAMAFVIPREDIIWVGGAAIGVYAAMCSAVGILRMRAISDYTVPFDKLTEFLNREDIVIL